MECIYRAWDGTIFDDKEECEAYEEKADKKFVHLFDENFNEYETLDSRAVQDAVYYFVENEAAKEKLEKLADDYDLTYGRIEIGKVMKEDWDGFFSLFDKWEEAMQEIKEYSTLIADKYPYLPKFNY